jgi:hypothetical protein
VKSRHDSCLRGLSSLRQSNHRDRRVAIGMIMTLCGVAVSSIGPRMLGHVGARQYETLLPIGHRELFGLNQYKSLVFFLHTIQISYAQTLIHLSGLGPLAQTPTHSFWVKAINTTYFYSKHLYCHQFLENTPYEILNGRKPSIAYFWLFG